MNRILLVEDSKTFGSLVVRRLKALEGLHDVDWARDYNQARLLLQDSSHAYDFAVLDLNLPDAPDGQVVDLVLSYGVAGVVLTGEVNSALKAAMWAKNITDYIVKDSIDAIDYLAHLVSRLLKNPRVGILVVDDSPMSRNHISLLLRNHRYKVLSCASGREALAALSENGDIGLVITDYDMPGMNGLTLCREIRRKRKRDELTIIGMSGVGEHDISARFLKSGANDFLGKPFNNEEFYCRVMQNVELVEQFELIKNMAYRDPLTKLFNRRRLFEAGESIRETFLRQGRKMTVAMLDIDFFKGVNDTYGHDGGDAVLVDLARTMGRFFASDDIVARLGGEEFCVLGGEKDPETLGERFDTLRAAVKERAVSASGHTISYTVSIGVFHGMGDCLDEMLKHADRALYSAKAKGRDRVEVTFG